MGVEFGVGIAHDVHHRAHQTMQERVLDAELVAVAQTAADDSAQHVAAVLVGGQDAVGDQKRRGAGMVGDDAQRRIVAVGRCRVNAGDARDAADQRLQEVVVVVAAAALDDGGDPLQAHAGVHAGCFQGRQRAVRGAVELGKDEVPELGIAVAVFVRGARRPAGDFRPQVVEQFRIRAARPGVAHGPEVLLVGHHPLGWQPDRGRPDPARLVVAWMHRDPQPILRQLQDLGDELPRPDDGVFLEVVAEAEVAEHLEERLVAPGVADVLQIVVLAAGAHAALATDGATIVQAFAPGERVFELHHASVGEEQRGIVARHQRTRRHDAVATAGEEIQVGGAKVASQHRRARVVFEGRLIVVEVPDAAVPKAAARRRARVCASCSLLALDVSFAERYAIRRCWWYRRRRSS